MFEAYEQEKETDMKRGKNRTGTFKLCLHVKKIMVHFEEKFKIRYELKNIETDGAGGLKNKMSSITEVLNRPLLLYTQIK